MKTSRNGRLLVHVGMQRAASTFLQNVVFPTVKFSNYIGKTKGKYPDWMIRLHYLDDYCFDRNCGELKDEILSIIESRRLNIISSEGFCMYGGMYWTQAHRLKRICPESEVLIVLRNPIDRLISAYKYNIQHEGFCHTLEDSIDWKRTPFVFHKRKPYYLPDFYYDEIIEIYSELFGRSHVHVLRYEDLVNEPEKFLEQLNVLIDYELDISALLRVTKVRVNSSQSDDVVMKLRIKNIEVVAIRHGLKFDRDSLVWDGGDPLLSQRLKVRLEKSFSGRTAGYY